MYAIYSETEKQYVGIELSNGALELYTESIIQQSRFYMDVRGEGYTLMGRTAGTAVYMTDNIGAAKLTIDLLRNGNPEMRFTIKKLSSDTYDY